MAHDHSLSTQRIELFSDAVFAIIVTLLVLELKVPHLLEDATVTQTLDELVLMTPKFLSFVFSFLIICIFWVNHHQFFFDNKNYRQAVYVV